MEKRFEVLPPTMPNFVRFKKEAGLKQDGFNMNDGFPITNFTKEEAEEYFLISYGWHWEAINEKEKLCDDIVVGIWSVGGILFLLVFISLINKILSDTDD